MIRLELAMEEGLIWPEGPVAMMGPAGGADFADIEPDRLRCVQGFYPDFKRLEARGLSVSPSGMPDASGALICLPRAKALARGWIAAASARVGLDGILAVDGQKTDGVDSVLKDIKRRATVLGTVSKAHGKLVWFQGGDFSDWALSQQRTADGFVTGAGIFSADAMDPASAALAGALPAKLGARVADFGAGWGALSLAAMTRDKVTSVDLIEASWDALEAARINVADPKAQFIWADIAGYEPKYLYDWIISNPPFHTSRKADPALGRAFIASAARCLAPGGQFWMVANRHLPYEAALQDHFAEVREVEGTSAFKLIAARKPKKAARRG